MSDKKRFNFTRAINSLLKRQSLLDAEAQFDCEIRRRIQDTNELQMLRASHLPGNQYSFFAPVLSTRTRRDVSAGGAGSGLVSRQDLGLRSDLLQWSACVTQGAELLTDCIGDLSTGITTVLPAPSWISETGAIAETNTAYSRLDLKPKRVSAKIIASSMLLTASPDAENLITSDMGKALSNQLDKAALYGAAPGGLQPTGIASHPDTHKIALDPLGWWTTATELERLCAEADVSMAQYGEIVSPVTARDLKRVACAADINQSTWSAMTKPLSSNVVYTNAAFGGCWDSMVIAVWALEIIVDPFTQSPSGQVIITGHLFCDVGLRYPAAFGAIQ